MTRDGLLFVIGNMLALMVGIAVVWWAVGHTAAFVRRVTTGGAGQRTQREARVTPAPAIEDRAAPAPLRDAPDYGAWVAAQAGPALDWLRAINDEPDHAPHVAAVGPSGSGKSTLVLAALTRRPGQLVITTPKSAADDPWGGFPAVRTRYDAESHEPDYSAIGAAWRAVYAELNARHADGSRPRPPITLIIDELSTCLDELRHLDPQRMLIRMWLTGRSVGVRLIALDPTMNVKGWGIDGRGDVRESILFVRTARDKSAHFFEWNAQRNVPFNERPFDTSDVPALAAAGLDPARVWIPDAPRSAGAPAQLPAAAPLFSAPTSADVTTHEAALVRAWRAEGETDARALGRRLYAARGGQNEAFDGSGAIFYAVKAALEPVAAVAALQE